MASRGWTFPTRTLGARGSFIPFAATKLASTLLARPQPPQTSTTARQRDAPRGTHPSSVAACIRDFKFTQYTLAPASERLAHSNAVVCSVPPLHGCAESPHSYMRIVSTAERHGDCQAPPNHVRVVSLPLHTDILSLPYIPCTLQPLDLSHILKKR